MLLLCSRAILSKLLGTIDHVTNLWACQHSRIAFEPIRCSQMRALSTSIPLLPCDTCPSEEISVDFSFHSYERPVDLGNACSFSPETIPPHEGREEIC